MSSSVISTATAAAAAAADAAAQGRADIEVCYGERLSDKI